MKNIYGSYIIYIIAFSFIIIFTGYICISINQTKAFNAKNEVVKAIERDYPFRNNTTFLRDVNDAFIELGYRMEGSCDVGANNFAFCRTNNGIEECAGTAANNALFCVHDDSESRAGLDGHIYTIKTFYTIDFFAFNSSLLFDMSASGKTKWLYSSVGG